MDPNTIDQQRRVIMDTRGDCASMLDLASRIQTRLNTFQRLSLGDAGVLSDEAFSGTGTDQATYLAAISALGTFAALDADVWAALERFAR